MNESLIRWRDLQKLVAVTRVTIDRWQRAGLFPAPVRVGTRGVAWVRAEVDAWIAACKEARQ